MEQTIFWHDAAGAVGIALILLSYFGLVAGRLRGDGLIHQSMNLLGALLVGVWLLYNFSLSAFLVVSLWAVISLFGLARGWQGRADRPR